MLGTLSFLSARMCRAAKVQIEAFGWAKDHRLKVAEQTPVRDYMRGGAVWRCLKPHVLLFKLYDAGFTRGKLMCVVSQASIVNITSYRVCERRAQCSARIALLNMSIASCMNIV